MIVIMGKTYLTTKEASKRYGFSAEWFHKQRTHKKLPPYVKFQERGRILYPIDECDKWFKEAIKPNY